MERIGIERLCVFGMPPVDYVTMAADVGVRWIGIGLMAMRYYTPDGYPDWSLRTDPALRQDMLAAMADRGVALSMVEGVHITADSGRDDYERDLDLIRSLGAPRLNVASLVKDKGRALDGFALVAELAEARGLDVTIEVAQPPNVNLAASLETIAYVGRPNFKLMIDTMHYFRFGGSIAEIEALDKRHIGYIQLADVPWQSTFDSYFDEALHDRKTPGEGELPLREFLALVPRDIVVSVEIPQRADLLRGLSARDRVANCVAGARRLMPPD